MRRARWRRLAWLAAVLAVAACEPQPRRVVLVGDSITVGSVSEPAGPPYAALLEERLRGRAELVNLACGGTTSRDWTRSHGARTCKRKAFLPNLYEGRVRPALPADLAVVLLGTNDGRSLWRGQRIPAEDYGANLREIVEALRADGAARVMLLSPPLVSHSAGATLHMLGYRRQIQALCAGRDDVVCGPDLLTLLRLDDFAEGELHPHGAGHAKIAEALDVALQPLL